MVARPDWSGKAGHEEVTKWSQKPEELLPVARVFSWVIGSEQGLLGVLPQTKSNAIGQQAGHALGPGDLRFAWPKPAWSLMSPRC